MIETLAIVFVIVFVYGFVVGLCYAWNPFDEKDEYLLVAPFFWPMILGPALSIALVRRYRLLRRIPKAVAKERSE